MGRSNEHVGAAIFAAEGSVRHRTVRIAVAAGGALLAAWLIALALGVLGGFDSLPGLPSAQSNGSHEASSPAHRTVPSSTRVLSQAEPVRTVAPKPAGGGSTSAPSQGSPHAPSAGTVTQHPSTSSPTSSTSSSAAGTQGKSAAHTTQTTGKPTGSPGNGSGGSGAPGQLR